MEGSPFETLVPELEFEEARLMANVMIAERFKCGQGEPDAALWDLRGRLYFGDAEAKERIRALYRETRRKGQKRQKGQKQAIPDEDGALS
ncbi:MAG: hypothetical protein LBG29_02475 [Synergistaceae bacterium]|nr:hypothetical protein [Synergistaceae bacterium]